MEKSTKVSLKKRRTVLLRPHVQPQKKKTHRRIRKERQAKLSFVGTGLIIFAATFGVLAFVFIRKHDLISPLAEERKVVLAAAKKVNEDTSKIQKYLAEKKIAYATIDRLSGSAYLVHLKTGEEVLLSDDKDILKQLASLQLILARLTMEGKQALRLDFRYDKPVVTLK